MNCRLWPVAMLCLLALSGCGLSRVTPLTDAANDFAQSQDEASLITRAGAIDKDLQQAGLVVEEPTLQAYVDQVAGRVVPEGIAARAPLRFRVLRLPAINAAALPNGSVYIALGLLARLENEAQLAHVLAHEVTHVVQRHALSRMRSYKAGRIAANATEIATLGIGAIFVGVPVALSLTSFARSQEEEADKMGLIQATRAGYHAEASSGAYDAVRRALPTWMAEYSSIYASHPSLQARATYLRQTIEHGEIHGATSGRVARDEFEKATTPVQHEYLQALIAAKQFNAAIDWASRLRERGLTTAAIWCAEGDAHLAAADDAEGVAFETAIRTQGRVTDASIAEARASQPAHADAALRSYQSCADIDAHSPAALRGIGLASRRLGDASKAHDALLRYLESGADQGDRRYIAALLAADGKP